MRWSLDDIYPGLTDGAYGEDLRRLDECIDESLAFCRRAFVEGGDGTAALEGFVDRSRRIHELLVKTLAYARLVFSCNADDTFAPKAMARLMQAVGRLVPARVAVERWLVDRDDLDALTVPSPLLTDHRLLLERIREDAGYMLTEAEEILLAKLAPTAGSSWADLHETLVATHVVTWTDGVGVTHREPLSVVRERSHSPLPDVRRRAFEVERASFGALARVAAAALNAIKGEELMLCEHRGYRSPLHRSLAGALRDESTLRAMWTAVDEFLPVFRSFYRRKAELLGHQRGLPAFDLRAPLGATDRRFTFAAAAAYVVDGFRTFSDSLADFAARAVERRWVDAEPRAGKGDGCFCCPIHPLGQSRVLVNFGGNFADVFDLAHELGHAYHAECMRGESILNSQSPLPLAETASVFCETIVWDFALSRADGDEMLYLLDQHICEALAVIVDVYARFVFEEALFEQRRSHPLSVDELRGLMAQARRRTYGDGLDPSALDEDAWVTKSHYYLPSCSFYNFPYCFGILFTLGLYERYRRVGRPFADDYVALLARTGKCRPAEIVRSMGMDIADGEFWRASLRVVAGRVEQFLALEP